MNDSQEVYAQWEQKQELKGRKRVEMPVVSNEIHTFSCSVPECPTTRTLTGKLGDLQLDLINKEGWVFDDLTFGGNSYDLCPAHNKELRAYFGLDQYPNNMYPNEAGDFKIKAINVKVKR